MAVLSTTIYDSDWNQNKESKICDDGASKFIDLQLQVDFLSV